MYGSGCAHERRANKNSYPYDGRTNKDSYSHKGEKIFTGLIKVIFFSFEINIFQKSFIECCLFWASDRETYRHVSLVFFMSERTLMFSLDFFFFFFFFGSL